MAWTTTAMGWHTYDSSPLYRGSNPYNAAIGSQASSVQYFGVTWTFDTDYTVGQFIDGSWWVVDPGDGVTINSVSPAPSSGRNGSMVNPVSGGGQGFHSGANAYNAELSVSFPLSINAGDVLLSSVEKSDNTMWDGTTLNSTHVFLKEVGVLTVLASPPPVDAFRPSYCDRTQTIYTISQIVADNIPSVSTAGITSPSAGNFASAAERLARGVSRPWMVFVPDWQSRNSHPQLHQNNYHREIGQYLSELCCFVCSDDPNKEAAVHGLIQLGIDHYHAGLNGQATGDFWVAPTIMAGHFLNDLAMKNCFINDVMQCVPRDCADFFLMSDMTATTQSAHIPTGEAYAGHLVGFRNNLALNREYEHLRPDEWVPLTANGDEAWKDDTYRTGTDSHTVVGMALAAQLCGLQSEWAHDATFAYVQRYMIDADVAAERGILDTYYPGGLDYPPTSATKTSRNAFVDSMFNTYWTEYVWV